jgi:1-phosphofructokinase family hexose kinase
MILTVTPNPAVDRVIFVRDFHLGAVIRAEREAVSPCGKGVSSSLVLHELGGGTRALGLQAGPTGALHAALLDNHGVPHEFVPADGDTRMAVVLVDIGIGQQSTITAPTLQARPVHLTKLLGLVERYAGNAWGLISGGSLPAGLPADSHAQVLRCAQQLGLRTLLDASGQALVQGVPGQAHILKVNHHELEMLDSEFGNRIAPGNARPRLEKRLGEWASDAVIVTLGECGAIAVTQAGAYWARPPRVPVVNTAGAGDALGAGVMLALSRGDDWRSALRLGTAAAASVVMNEGTAICQRAQVEALLAEVRISEL